MRKLYIKPFANVISDESFCLCAVSPRWVDEETGAGGNTLNIGVTSTDAATLDQKHYSKEQQNGWDDQYDTFDW